MTSSPGPNRIIDLNSAIACCYLKLHLTFKINKLYAMPVVLLLPLTVSALQR
ncbi:hypothetical protein P20429_0245 [Pseudoalteromonas sp. BSi20429]|nr:hypothetical protein P20429_0245 [Pseudoalteromonas sp. BSi20429]